MNAAATAAAIVRILSIKDTREYVEQGDRWVPIPGSGEPSECARCGRNHEVHATVELDDGTTEVVGTGCATRAAMTLAKEFRAGESRAKRIAALNAEIVKWARVADEYRAARAKVDAMPVPPVVVAKVADYRYTITCGDATVYASDVSTFYLREREEQAVCSWKNKRVDEIEGITYSHASGAGKVADARKRLAKLAD